MDRSHATYEAYDGVELRLLNERVVRCEALGVAEAIHFLRMMSRVERDFSAHYEFMQEFPPRAKLDQVPLADLGMELEGPGGAMLECAGVTVAEALKLLELLTQAESGEPGPQSDFLDRFPAAIDVDPATLTPAETFELGRTFAQEVYRLIYGIASDFLSHLTMAPSPQVMTMVRARTTRTRRTMSMPASTT